MSAPRVSVVTLNYNGGDDTLACLESLGLIEQPGGGIEIIVVDNASQDGSADAIAAARPDVRLIRSDRNTGFAGGCNLGAAAATGEFIAFINNDARADVRWLVEAVHVLEQRADVACAASTVLSWDGTAADYVGRAGVTFYGFGYREGFGEPFTPADLPAEPTEVLFGTGSGLIVRADAFRQIDGFDDRFFLFFEDVDFGWRLWLAGHTVLHVPASVVYHRHHGTMDREQKWREDYFLERNALFSIIKNLDDAHLARALPAALLLAVRRGFLHEKEPSDALDLEHGRDDDAPRISVGKRAAASAFAIDQVARRLPELLEARRAVQTTRVRTDAEIFRLVQRPLLPSMLEKEFQHLVAQLNELLDLDGAFRARKRIAIVTGDPLTRRLSGPGMRAMGLATVLGRDHDVKLVSTNEAVIEVPGIEVDTARTWAEVKALEQWCDVLVFQGFLLHQYPRLQQSSKVIVVDLYDPFHLEQLEQSRDLDPATRARDTATTVDVLNEQARRGDFFLCASPKQRDFWLGHLAAAGRINPSNYDNDRKLDALIDIVPFGIPATPAIHDRPVLRGVVPGIGPDDRIALWGGGLYPWFDPATLIRGAELARMSVPNLRLVFLAGKHPHADVPASSVADDAKQLAAELGLLDTHVFFIEKWIDYDDRQNYLLEADVGVTTHFDHVETAFSFRTRILDYFWAGLPVLTTTGDSISVLIEEEALGEVVGPGDIKGAALALERLLGDEAALRAIAARVRAIAPRFSWDLVAQPLVDFCAAPTRAPDLRLGMELARSPLHTESTGRLATARRLAGAARRSLREAGVAATARRVIARLRP